MTSQGEASQNLRSKESPTGRAVDLEEVMLASSAPVVATAVTFGLNLYLKSASSLPK